MASRSTSQGFAANGWTAVPRSQTKVVATLTDPTPASIVVDDIKIPDSEVARKTYEYAKKELPAKTFNHSMRVFYYGAAIVKHLFPQWTPFLETYFLTCLLHDIGATDTNLNGTRMSFEYYGAFVAINFLQHQAGASKDQAESVGEAIIRHADIGETGNLTSLGQLIQFSTLFDNLGANPHLISKSTIESVVAAYPRNKWSSCFADTMREEERLKPWCHSTANEGFIEDVVANSLMEPYE